MEAAMLTFARQMPIAPLAKMSREHDTRIWWVIEHHVHGTRAKLDFSSVSEVGCEETSAKRGQDYISLFMDLAERRVMFATAGRDAETVKAFADDLAAHGGEPKTQVKRVCCDMSPAFIKGVRDHLSEKAEQGEETPEQKGDEKAPALAAATTTSKPSDAVVSLDEAPDEVPVPHCPEIIFDRYHVVAKANEAVDEVRRAEPKSRPELKQTR